MAGRDPLVPRILAEQRWDVIPGAEPAADFSARVAAGIERVLDQTGEDATAAAFVHGAVISEVLAAATGSRPLAFLFADNASITELDQPARRALDGARLQRHRAFRELAAEA